MKVGTQLEHPRPSHRMWYNERILAPRYLRVWRPWSSASRELPSYPSTPHHLHCTCGVTSGAAVPIDCGDNKCQVRTVSSNSKERELDKERAS